MANSSLTVKSACYNFVSRHQTSGTDAQEQIKEFFGSLQAEIEELGFGFVPGNEDIKEKINNVNKMFEPCVSLQEHRRELIKIASDVQKFCHEIVSAMLACEASKRVQQYVCEEFDGITLDQFSHMFDQKNMIISVEKSKVLLDEEGKRQIVSECRKFGKDWLLALKIDDEEFRSARSKLLDMFTKPGRKFDYKAAFALLEQVQARICNNDDLFYAPYIDEVNQNFAKLNKAKAVDNYIRLLFGSHENFLSIVKSTGDIRNCSFHAASHNQQSYEMFASKIQNEQHKRIFLLAAAVSNNLDVKDTENCSRDIDYLQNEEESITVLTSVDEMEKAFALAKPLDTESREKYRNSQMQRSDGKADALGKLLQKWTSQSPEEIVDEWTKPVE
jgi:hypothetical protein